MVDGFGADGASAPTSGLFVVVEQAADVYFGVIEHVAHQVFRIAEQGRDVGLIPTALGHGRRESTDDSKAPHHRHITREHGRYNAVIAVQNGQRTVRVNSNKNHGGVHRGLQQFCAQHRELAEKRVA